MDVPTNMTVSLWDFRITDCQAVEVRFMGNFSLRHRVQTGSGAHLTSYPTGTGGSFPGFKAAGA